MRWLNLPLLVLLAAGGATGSLEVRTESGAEVVWEGTSLGATDGQGVLRVQEIPPGVYRLAVRGAHSEISTTVEIGSGVTILQLPLPGPPATPARGSMGSRPSQRPAIPAAESPAPEPAPQAAPPVLEPQPAVAASPQAAATESAAGDSAAAPAGSGEPPAALGEPQELPPASVPAAAAGTHPAVWVLGAVGLAALAATLAWRRQARRSRRRRRRRRPEVVIERVEVRSAESAGRAPGFVEQLRARERRLEDLVNDRRGRRVVDIRDVDQRGDRKDAG